MAITPSEYEDIGPFWLQISDPGVISYNGNATGYRKLVYYDRLDRIYCVAKNNPGSLHVWGYCDPIFLDGTKPSTNFGMGVGQIEIRSIAVGEWNRISGVQNIYGWDTALATGKLQIRDPNSLAILSSDPFPNIRMEDQVRAPTTDGYYYMFTREVMIFETPGYLICPEARLRYDGVTYNNISIQVDLATGYGTPIEGLFGEAAAVPTDFQEPEVYGDSFFWGYSQFVPDDDSTAISPKGYLWWSTRGDVTGAGVSATAYGLARKIEWNPDGVTGTPSRVHKRVLFTTRVELDETAIGSGASWAAHPLVIHPLTGRLLLVINYFNDPTVANSQILVHYSPQPGFAEVTPAAPTKRPQVGGTTPFACETIGSLGEAIAGVDVDWILERVAEVDERFEGSVVGVGGTYTLDEGPADSGTIVVIEDPDGAATVLATPGDYTINGPRTQITGAGGKWDITKTYAVAYEHKATPLSPSHGTLLVASSASDANGQAFTRVLRPDTDFDGGWDQLTAEVV
jgi:hypothetical protein